MEISESQQKKSSHPLINSSSKLAIVGLPLFFPFFDGVVGLLYWQLMHLHQILTIIIPLNPLISRCQSDNKRVQKPFFFLLLIKVSELAYVHLD